MSTYYEDRNVNIVMRELNGLMKSFMYASSGFRALTTERNTVIHIAVAVLVIISAAFFQITRAEWMFLILAISLVVSLELMNNAIERLCSKYTTKYNEDIKFIKDAAAAAVLISSVAAFVTGMVIFMPRIIDIVSR
ncbi:MAG: hypothetical protein A3B96_01885 [Candidatus Spechtbacteria bacterium RIFCSPHIGHO2_02_FULL_43_15b]|uniref:Diacylglycerol kinase n=1 Tax=Candidatus Spechtbacteria bacterium RIFCSPHIGHO2_01_FULL_43_30 TaxID=1802158 RepID=A0A1G2H7C9_9BACT|nr:MAG: hypothetical protein A2827_02225 [Candidatus Spechtbacteria bacterium RIFCSPHIGHO2_01_FULL_43_30]OGZ60142.1 MAG: hypothetical protein A3B96_01885 [Candidatus Spechtbacteria bacterium RIFCSPHIGHO2_02_FULL_43_15b]